MTLAPLSLADVTLPSPSRPRRITSPSRTAQSVSDVFVTREHEKRQCIRRCMRCRIELFPHPDNEPYPTEILLNALPLVGRCCNISDMGMYGVVPARYGVAVGQNFLFRFHIAECGPEPESGRIVTQHGRILRAELFGISGKAGEVGIAALLYGHREGVIPMPLRM